MADFEVLTGVDPNTGELPEAVRAWMETVYTPDVTESTIAAMIDDPASDTRASLDARYATRVGEVDALSLVSATTPPSSTEGRGLAVRGRYLYLAANNHLFIYDVSVPSAPVKLKDIADLSCVGSESMVLAGRYLYVKCIPGNVAQGFTIYDVSNPLAPVSYLKDDATNIRNEGNGCITVRGRFVYITSNGSGTGQLTIYDVSNPAAPTYCGKYSASGMNGAGETVLVGDYAFVSANSALYAINVSDPYNPTLASTAGVYGSNGLSVRGKYAYTNRDKYVTVVDISNPASIQGIATVTDPTLATGSNDLYRSTIAGNYLYIADRLGNGVAVFDLTNPENPTLAATYTTGPTPASLDHPVAVRAVGRYLYVSCGSYAQFGVFDLLGIDQPAACVGTLTTEQLEVGTASIIANLSVGESLAVGQGGIASGGPVALQGGAVLRSGTGAPTMAGRAGQDYYLRTDTPTTSNQRLYVCTTSGAAGAAVWTGIL